MRTWFTYFSSPLEFLNKVIPPTACFAFRGTVIEFIMRPRLDDTPSANGSVWKARPLVSYENEKVIEIPKSVRQNTKKLTIENCTITQF